MRDAGYLLTYGAIHFAQVDVPCSQWASSWTNGGRCHYYTILGL